MNNLVHGVHYLETQHIIDFINANNLNNHIMLVGACSDDMLGYAGLVGKYKAYNEACRGNCIYTKRLSPETGISVITDYIGYESLSGLSADRDRMVYKRVNDINTIPHKTVDGIRCHDSLHYGEIEYITGLFLECLSRLYLHMTNVTDFNDRIEIQYRVLRMLNTLAKCKITNSVNIAKLKMFCNEYMTKLSMYGDIQEMLGNTTNLTVESLFNNIITCGTSHYAKIYEQIACCNPDTSDCYAEIQVMLVKNNQHKYEIITDDFKTVEVYDITGTNKTTEAMDTIMDNGYTNYVNIVRGQNTVEEITSYVAVMYGKVREANNHIDIILPQLAPIDDPKYLGNIELLNLIAYPMVYLEFPYYTDVRFKV